MTDPGKNPTPGQSPLTPERARQARAWAIALDPVYGLIGFGLIGYLIDRAAGTSLRWLAILAITGLIAGFVRFIREATSLNRDNTAKWKGRPFRPVEPEPSDNAPEDQN